MYKKLAKYVRGRQSKGFTIVEIAVVVGVSMLLVGVIVSFMIGTTNQFAVSTTRSQLNVQLNSAMNRMESDIRQAQSVLDTNKITTNAAAPVSDGGVWYSGDDQLILSSWIRGNDNTPIMSIFLEWYGVEYFEDYQDNIIYYIKDNTLYRRLIALDSALGNKYETLTCASSAQGGCPTDTVILNNVDAFNITYYDSSGAATTSYSSAESIKIDVTIKVTTARQTITAEGSSTFRLLGDASVGVVAEAPDPEPEPEVTPMACFNSVASITTLDPTLMNLVTIPGPFITDYYNRENNSSSQPACPKDVVIPDTFVGIGKTIYTSGDFFENKGINSVIFPDSMQYIAGSAFRNNNLTSVVLPNAVENIGDYTFYDNDLTSVTLPNSLNSIGSYAFRYNQINSIDFPNSLTHIGAHAFNNNAISGHVYIPPNVNDIDLCGFCNNPSLTTASVPLSTLLLSAFPSATTVTRY